MCDEGRLDPSTGMTAEIRCYPSVRQWFVGQIRIASAGCLEWVGSSYGSNGWKADVTVTAVTPRPVPWVGG